MSELRLLKLTSSDQLREDAARWDDLWRRSEVSPPTLQADAIADWIEHFSPGARALVMAVECQGRLVAGLPLVGQRLRGWVPVGSLTNNPWNSCGDLLWDEGAGEAALDVLAEAIARLPWPLFWAEGVALDSARWLALVAALERQGLCLLVREDCRVGQVALTGDFESFAQGWSKNHRQKMRKAIARLEREGPATLRTRHGDSPAEVADIVQEAFAVEDRSWKGAAGTSVVKTPGALNYFTRLAERCAMRGQLEVHFLDHDGQAISFSFGYRDRGVYYMHKVGYDELYAQASPTNILVQRLLEWGFQSRALHTLDFFGPLQDWTSKWSTSSYRVGRVVVARRGIVGRLLGWGYRELYPRWKAYREARKNASARAADSSELPKRPNPEQDAHAGETAEPTPIGCP